jgi:hypothetical protein
VVLATLGFLVMTDSVAWAVGLYIVALAVIVVGAVVGLRLCERRTDASARPGTATGIALGSVGHMDYQALLLALAGMDGTVAAPRGGVAPTPSTHLVRRRDSIQPGDDLLD